MAFMSNWRVGLTFAPSLEGCGHAPRLNECPAGQPIVSPRQASQPWASAARMLYTPCPPAAHAHPSTTHVIRGNRH